MTSGVSKVDVSKEDIESILNVLVYDGKIRKVPGTSSSYQVMRRYGGGSFKTPFVEIPCGVCPVIKLCSDKGPITPRTCRYYQSWLEY
jgi:DNA-directed RNA polymerase III subunit RPC6